MQRLYAVVLAVACVVIYSWLCTRMIPLLASPTATKSKTSTLQQHHHHSNHG